MAHKLVVIRGKVAGTEVALEGSDVFVVGSGTGAHVRLPDEGVRPEHARLFPDGARLILMDTSGEGVVVNGRRETQAELKVGDELAIGKALLRLATRVPPASGAAAQLVVLKGPDEGKQFHVEKRMTLGRGTTADCPLLDVKCSREHCAIELGPRGYAVVDLGSTNGTRLNEVKLEPRGPQPLKTGDRIRLGATVLEFHAPGAPVPPPAPPAVAHVPASVGKAFEIDLGDLEAPAIVPAPDDDSRRRGAVTQRVRPSGLFRAQAAAALSGELERMGLAEIVQLLNQQRKTGELTVQSPAGDHGLAFSAGNVVDAWTPRGVTGESAFHALARLTRGHFEFHEKPTSRPARITRATLALLMDVTRIINGTTDHGE